MYRFDQRQEVRPVAIRPVVRGLSRCVHDELHVMRVAGEDRSDPVDVANVKVEMVKRVQLGHAPLGDSPRRGLGPEEMCAHVAVDADHVEARLAEEPDRLGADQPA